MVSNKYIIFIFLLVTAVACKERYFEGFGEMGIQLPEIVDYNFHIKPLLSDRCFKCHGPDANQRKADLRLDDADFAYERTLLDESAAGKIIKPGHPSGSEVYHRITSNDQSYLMPPPESNLQLSDYDKALITKWIDQGARYKTHWSFIAPQEKGFPKVSNESWGHNPIDRLILKDIEDAGLKPSPPAEPVTLFRRIALDITGLPPTPEEIDEFLNDTAPEAYERAIDRLLASSRYGERMALEWLDAARYADSHGYQDDGMRTTWPYRDWVINAFNQNMPYDQFLIEQLAGDLLPEPTRDQLVATCFNRNHPQTQEGGVVDEEYRVEYVADRVNTIGEAILGLTFECARCHDHKYDPISQKDYYSMFAFFNNNNDTGIVPYNGEAAPTVMLPTAEESRILNNLEEKIEPLEQALDPQIYNAAFNAWWNKGQQTVNVDHGKVVDFNFDSEVAVVKGSLNLDNKKDFKPPKPGTGDTEISYLNSVNNKPDATISGGGEKPSLVDGRLGQAILLQGDAGLRFSRDLDFDRHQPFSVSLWVKLLKSGEAGPIFNNSNGDFEGYRGWLCKVNPDGTLSFQFNHVWPDNCIDFQTTDTLETGEWTHIALTYNGSSMASGIQFFVNGEEPRFIVHKDNLNKSLLHGVEGSNWSNLPFMIGVELRKSIENMAFDELAIWDRQLSRIEVQKVYSGKEATEYIEEDWLQYYLLNGNDPTWNDLMDSLTALRAQENLVSTNVLEVMIMQEKKYPRPTYVLDRGGYDAPAEEVKAELPSSFTGGSPVFDSNRMGLARWVVSKDNPLTARVQVNRIWMMLFGKGMVATQEDFGSQGDLPSHPDLLDYLAIDFVENGWDIKYLVKQILLSATYRQSSIVSEEAREKDPANDLYTRFPVYRLPAEVIRDNALAASGLLTDSIGGPSVYPYQPAGLWEALATRNATSYEQDSGQDLYRRSLYTVWKRSSPPPAMMNFDAPDRYSCVVRRQKTSTPLQSLVLMNDPQFVEASRVLAQNTLLDVETGPVGQIDHLFKRLLSRPASEEELVMMNNLYQEERVDLDKDVKRQNQLLNIGEYPIDQRIDPKDLAALTMVASTLMNYDEFVMKR